MIVIATFQVNDHRFVRAVFAHSQDDILQIDVKQVYVAGNKIITKLSGTLLHRCDITIVLVDNDIPNRFRYRSIIVTYTVRDKPNSPIRRDKTIAMADTEKIRVSSHQVMVTLQLLDIGDVSLLQFLEWDLNYQIRIGWMQVAHASSAPMYQQIISKLDHILYSLHEQG